MAMIERVGFGQVEPNHLSAQRTAQIYAQLPCKEDIKILENGQYVKYDYLNKEINFTGSGEWMLVYNEEKLYGEAIQEGHKDFAMKKSAYTEGVITPRVFKTNIGDIYTTNAVGGPNTSNTEKYAGIDIDEGDTLTPDPTTGFLIKGQATADMVWQVVKIYTMPDGQPAIKLMRIK